MPGKKKGAKAQSVRSAEQPVRLEIELIPGVEEIAIAALQGVLAAEGRIDPQLAAEYAMKVAVHLATLLPRTGR